MAPRTVRLAQLQWLSVNPLRFQSPDITLLLVFVRGQYDSTKRPDFGCDLQQQPSTRKNGSELQSPHDRNLALQYADVGFQLAPHIAQLTPQIAAEPIHPMFEARHGLFEIDLAGHLWA